MDCQVRIVKIVKLQMTNPKSQTSMVDAQEKKQKS